MAFSSIEEKREYFREYYKKRRDKYLALLGGKCIKCSSEEDLQFDHRSPEEKSLNISKLMNYSEAKVLEELKKCQLLCKSCHEKKTFDNKDGYFKKAKGEEVNSAILTELEVLRIRKLLETYSTVEVARMYGLNRGTTLAIKQRKTWKHI